MLIEQVVPDEVGRYFSILATSPQPWGVVVRVTPKGDLSFKDGFAMLSRDLSGRYVLRVVSPLPESAIALIPSPRERRGARAALKVAAFVATLATVALSGGLMSSQMREVLSHLPPSLGELASPPSDVIGAALFTASIFSILGLHEFGHMLSERIWGGRWEIPIFIPAPPPLGTFGAVILSGRPVINRDEAYDLGISGPLAGFIPATLVSIIGLSTSVYLPPGVVEEAVRSGEMALASLPQPLLFHIAFQLLSPPGDWVVLLSPVAFAGWAGLVLTFLNLMPAGQLDGGHVAYALMGRSKLSHILLLITVLIAVAYSLPMALLALLMSVRGHPPAMDPFSGLSRGRKIFGSLLYLALLLLTMPVPT